MRIFVMIVGVFLGTAVNGQYPDISAEEMKEEAKQAYKQSNYNQAIFWLDLLISIDSSDAPSLNLRACATIFRSSINDKKNNDTAIVFFTRAIRHDTTNYRYYVNRGWALQTMDKYQSSLKDFRKALILDSAVVDLHNKVLMSLYVQNRNKEAYALANRIIGKFPEDGYAWYVRGNLKRDYLHKYPEGNKDIKKSEELGWKMGYRLYDE
jgi:tetratricopeptide (TPR) repeat protein